MPPVKEKPKKYKKTRQVESTTYKGRPIVRKIKVLRKIKDDFDPQDGKKATTITCCKLNEILLYTIKALPNLDVTLYLF